MIEVSLHFRGFGSEKRTFPAMPGVGHYIVDGRNLWLVENVVFGPAVNVYAIEICSELAKELRAEWATWQKAEVAPE